MLFKQILATLVAVALLSVTCTQSHAGIISTQQALSTEARATTEQQVLTALAREDVRQAMQHYGVSPADADARVASLSDAELLQLQDQIDRLPAGGDGLLAVLGIVFVVLLILELVGVTNIFTRV